MYLHSLDSGVVRLVPLGGQTPIFDCSIRVIQTNLTSLIECLTVLLEISVTCP